MARERFLVVDDSPTILKLVQLVLTKAGFEVTTASDGEAALASAREDRPSVVLLDYMMPGQDGFEVCKALADDEALRAIPVVLMSAKGEEVQARFRQLPNVVDSISKPFSPEALLAVVTHVVDKHVGRPTESDGMMPLEITVDVADSRPVALSPYPASAALAGDVGAISIADVLTLLADQSQSGTLTLSHEHTRLRVVFRGGRVLLATAEGVEDEFLLGRFLVEAEELKPDALHAALEERKRDPDRAGLLGKWLVERDLITGAGLKKAIAVQTAALVFESLRWGGGRFWFEVGAPAPAEAEEGAPGLAVDALLMEGFRRVDEWRIIEREIGSFDLVFVRNEDNVASFGRARLTREEQSVLELINGRHTVRDIISFSRMGSFDATKMLYQLLRAKLVRRRTSPVAT